MSATDVIFDEVRELIRVRGIDPSANRSATRDLVDEVIRDYERRALRGTHPQLINSETIGQKIVDSVAGLGELQPYMDDPDVEEIWINEPGAVFVSKNGVSELTPIVLTDERIHELIERMLRPTGRRVDLSRPFVDASLRDGSRLHVVLPDITRKHPAVNIRKFVARVRTLDDMVRNQTMTPAAARFLGAAVASGANILISGATQAGKTTLLSTLASAIPARERVISCEEVFEIAIPSRDWVAMQCRQSSLEGTGEVTLRTLVKEALRMRPNRIVVGEVREAESLDLLISWNAGLPGLGTIHANSARGAVSKLTTLPLLAGENISSKFVIQTVASCLDIVVHCRQNGDGTRRIQEIIAVPGGVENGVVETEDLFHTVQGQLVRGNGYGHLTERFRDAGFDLHSVLEDRT